MNEDKPEKMPPVPPFVRFVASAVPMVFDDSLSYYEALCALWKYVQGMTDVINNNATLEEEYILKFDELKLFVDNYFDNLDVQEEINNKLDEMAEDGTLQEIIGEYLNTQVTWTFDTVADMKSATNLTTGSFVETLGFHTLGDGGGAKYYITDTGTADERSVIAIGSLYANLIEKSEVTPEMFGAYGDGTHDDTLAFQAALEYLFSSDANVSTWQLSGNLKLLAKSYYINDSLIDSDFSDTATRISMSGTGTRSAIICGQDCTTLIDNQNKIGFSNFEDINFVGSDNVFLYQTGATPQRMRFNRCNFTNFHTITDSEGSVDGSEFVFNQCAISHCGSSDNNCLLFKFNNPQAVNWRFYATDIEVFVGVCFHILKGTSIFYYQGSIIPTEGSTVFYYNDADGTTFGSGNFPTATMYGVRYELRDSKLIDGGNYEGSITIVHNDCSMGGSNITDSSTTIAMTSAVPHLVFNSCYNFRNYKYDIKMNRTLSAEEFYDGALKFKDCVYNDVVDMIDRSSLTANNGSNRRMLPSIFFNGQPIMEVSDTNLAKYGGQILQKNLTMITNYNSSSDSAGVKTFMPRKGFVTSLTLESVYTAGYGNTVQITAEIYNASNTLIGTGSVTAQSRTSVEIQVNAEVTSEWYVLLKNTSGNSYPIPHILYAEYLS